jgi:NADPH:quinone reductase-like Zn-dependent oxidoreductase
MAGEVVAVGDDVKKWSVGDRVCANFTLAHLYGDTDREIMDTALGGGVDGVLTEYRTFPAEVSQPRISCSRWH